MAIRRAYDQSVLVQREHRRIATEALAAFRPLNEAVRALKEPLHYTSYGNVLHDAVHDLGAKLKTLRTDLDGATKFTKGLKAIPISAVQATADESGVFLSEADRVATTMEAAVLVPLMVGEPVWVDAYFGPSLTTLETLCEGSTDPGWGWFSIPEGHPPLKNLTLGQFAHAVKGLIIFARGEGFESSDALANLPLTSPQALNPSRPAAAMARVRYTAQDAQALYRCMVTQILTADRGELTRHLAGWPPDSISPASLEDLAARLLPLAAVDDLFQFHTRLGEFPDPAQTAERLVTYLGDASLMVNGLIAAVKGAERTSRLAVAMLAADTVSSFEPRVDVIDRSLADAIAAIRADMSREPTG